MGIKLQCSLQLIEVIDAVIADDKWHVAALPAELPDWVEGLTKTAKKFDRGTGGNKYLSAVMGLQVWLRQIDRGNGVIHPRQWIYNEYLIKEKLRHDIYAVKAALENLPCNLAAKLGFGPHQISKLWLTNLRNYLTHGTPMPIIFINHDGRNYPSLLPRLL